MSDYRLPTYFEIEGEPFEIRDKGDYRMVLSCFNIMSNVELSEYEKIISCLMVFYSDFEDMDDLIVHPHINQLVEKMLWFFDCGQTYEQKKEQPILVDWDKDSNLICSAINGVIGHDIRGDEYVHWWTFISYYMAIGECSLAQIVSIRRKLAKGKKLEKHEKEYMQENPHYFNIDFRTPEQKALDAYVQSLWKGGVNKDE